MPETRFPIRTSTADPVLVAALRAASRRRDARRLQRRRFRPHPPGFSQRRHAPLARRRGDVERRPACIAIPAHRQRTAASRSRLSPDRAAAFAPRLEERVRRLSAAAFAVAAASGVRPHRLWTHPDRRAAPLAFLALCAADGRRARRHHPVRAVLRLGRAGDRSRQEAQRRRLRTFRDCRRASAPTRSPACRRTA